MIKEEQLKRGILNETSNEVYKNKVNNVKTRRI